MNKMSFWFLVSLASPNPGAIFVGTTYKAKSCQKAKNKWEKDKKAGDSCWVCCVIIVSVTCRYKSFRTIKWLHCEVSRSNNTGNS